MRRIFPAASVEDCRRYFESEGYCVLSVRRARPKFSLDLRGADKKIKPADFISFNQEFTAMIRAGFPVLRCLEAVGAGRKMRL